MRQQDTLHLLVRSTLELSGQHLSDSAVFKIRRPELVMVGRCRTPVGILGPWSAERVFDRGINCALVDITRTEVIDGSSSARSRPHLPRRREAARQL